MYIYKCTYIYIHYTYIYIAYVHPSSVRVGRTVQIYTKSYLNLYFLLGTIQIYQDNTNIKLGYVTYICLKHMLYR